MPRSNLILLSLFLALAPLGTMEAADTTAERGLTNSAPLQGTVRADSPALCEAWRSRAVVACRGNQWSWLMPKGYSMEQGGPEQVFLRSADRKRFIQVRVLAASGCEQESPDLPLLRRFALGKYPAATLAGESTRYVGGVAGPAFDLRWSIVANSWQAARILFVPSSAGLIEITLACLAEDFAEALLDLNTVLVTWTAARPGEELHIEPLSDML